MGEGKKSDRVGLYLTTTRRWEICALIGAFLILVSPFIYLSRDDHQMSVTVDSEPVFVGSGKCKLCHEAEYEKWHGSHHDLAMDVANEETVLGDFSNVQYTDPQSSITTRFFRDSNRFMVETEGADGQRGIFEISHVFGVYPLQQYLVPFPGGRLQCLNIGWDARESRWYRLPPYNVRDSQDWLHWTNGGQTWNGMCAECHSTRLSKGFDIQSETYTTTWFEIDVGCEACHGPGSGHLAWAEKPVLARSAEKTFGLTVIPDPAANDSQISICAPCHSRRFQLGDNDHGPAELLDKIVPSLLEEGLYYADGQILEEVYVYGSFTQSKMYMNGVQCSDCHDLHSLETHRQGNELCLQCHRGEEYDTADHHFHKRTYEGKPSEGHLCVKCHMPGRYYMGIDYRPDHSLRIPRPDLSDKTGSPNSCSMQGCHADKPVQWSIDYFTKWYGEKRKLHYGEILAEGRKRNPDYLVRLLDLASDTLLPTIVRATAVSLLGNYPSDDVSDVFETALQDTEPLVRYTAIRNISVTDQQKLLTLIAPKLYDSIKAVRIEAAVRLAAVPESLLREDDREAFHHALAEYKKAMFYNSDFAPQRYNLGNLASTLGKTDEAIALFESALKIDDQFYPAQVNLAMILNQNGENQRAETLLRKAVQHNPQLYEISYSLGLLLAEMSKFEDAAYYLGNAADGMPEYSRVRYNHALALLKLERWSEGIQALEMAVRAEPANEEYFSVLANLYARSGQREQAKLLAEQVLQLAPDHQGAAEVLQVLGGR